jgi:hypothetical protein
MRGPEDGELLSFCDISRLSLQGPLLIGGFTDFLCERLHGDPRRHHPAVVYAVIYQLNFDFVISI